MHKSHHLATTDIRPYGKLEVTPKLHPHSQALLAKRPGNENDQAF